MSTVALDLKPYHLTSEQVAAFDRDGFLILRNWITGDLLTRLQEAGHQWISDGLSASPDNPWFGDYNFAKREQGEVMFRVDYLHDKGHRASLDLLGCPQVLGVAESLCGPNFVPTYESMVFKQEGDGEVIRWHQDAVHPRRWRIFNFDLYLDASKKGAGALRVIPGSQIQKLDACRLEQEHGWDAPGVIHAEMEPGDVLLHDVMVVHGSERTLGNRLRRTIYYEFRAAEQIISEGPWDREWVDKRMRLVPLGLRAYQESYPDALQFEWQPSPEFRQAADGDLEAELKVAHVVHTNGSFCSAGSVV
jgi:hypothetical protein